MSEGGEGGREGGREGVSEGGEGGREGGREVRRREDREREGRTEEGETEEEVNSKLQSLFREARMVGTGTGMCDRKSHTPPSKIHPVSVLLLETQARI